MNAQTVLHNPLNQKTHFQWIGITSDGPTLFDFDVDGKLIDIRAATKRKIREWILWGRATFGLCSICCATICECQIRWAGVTALNPVLISAGFSNPFKYTEIRIKMIRTILERKDICQRK